MLTVDAHDAAGNHQTPSPSAPFKWDKRDPHSWLHGIEGNATPVTPRVIDGQPVSIHWLGEPSYAEFRSFDAYKLADDSPGIGVQRVVAYAQELSPATLAPVGARVLLPGHGFQGADGNYHYRANLSNSQLKSNALYRFEIDAADKAGNGAGPVAIPTDLFAWDTLAPVAELFDLADFLTFPSATWDLALNGTYQDLQGGVNSGVAELRVRVTRESGSGWSNATTVHLLANDTSGTYSVNATLLASDDGVNHTYCVQAVDAVGNVGDCPAAQRRATLVDLQAPSFSLVRPVDALLDVFTRADPLAVKLDVLNVAPNGRRAAPLHKVLFDVETTTYRELRAINLTSEDLRENAALSRTFTLDNVDGTLYALRGYVVDAAGNGAPAGSLSPANGVRRLGERLLYTFDAGTNADDVVGNRSLVAGASPAAPVQQNAKHDKGYRFDGNDDVLSTGVFGLGFGTSMTAMAWILPEDVANRPIFHNVSTSDAKWGLWLDADGALRGNVRAGASNASLAGPVLKPNVWHHVALVYNGTHARLVVNGTTAAAAPASGAVQEAWGFSLGRGRLGSATYSFKGLLDEVRVYKAALDDAAIDDARLWPYEAAPRATPDVLHLDRTLPLAYPVVDGLFQTLATVGVYAIDPVPLSGLLPSGVANVSLQTRTLAGDPVQGSVVEPGALTVSATGASIATGLSWSATRTIALPPMSAPSPLKVSVTTQDNLDPKDCRDAAQTGKARLRVLANGTEILSADLASAGREPIRRTATTAASIRGAVAVTLQVDSLSAFTPGCTPRPVVTFDDLLIETPAGLRLHADDFTADRGWTTSGGSAAMTVSVRGPARFADADASPVETWNETWPANAANGFAYNGTRQPGTSASYANDGWNSTKSAWFGTSGASASTIPVERLEKTLPYPIVPDRLSFVEKYGVTYTGAWGKREARMGVYVNLDTTPTKTILLQTGNFSRQAAVPANTILVNLSDNKQNNDWYHFDVDLAAILAENGLAGRRVTAVGLWLEKEFATPVSGATYAVNVQVDDVRFYRGVQPAQTRVDLPFPFPFYGGTYTTAWVDVNGVLGFRPFDASSPATGFASQPVIAAGWGNFTSRGGADQSGRAHGVYVSNLSRDAVTIAWSAAPHAAQGATNEMTATLLRTGEVVLRGVRLVVDAAVAQDDLARAQERGGHLVRGALRGVRRGAP
ncbi:MAG TPA: LamG domain-containing protein, partial [Candidatus Thermoplasmatota archaeon]|nr:LamG domain-containing protein [Candidatus Thermoplasmatota archaeon]